MKQTYFGENYVPTLTDYSLERERLIGCTNLSIRETISQAVDRLISQGDYWSLDPIMCILQTLSCEDHVFGYDLQRAVEDVYRKIMLKGEKVYIIGYPRKD